MRFFRVKLRGRMTSCPFFLLDRLAVLDSSKTFDPSRPALFG
jgi:hypothetical protein